MQRSSADGICISGPRAPRQPQRYGLDLSLYIRHGTSSPGSYRGRRNGGLEARATDEEIKSAFTICRLQLPKWGDAPGGPP